MTQPVEAFPFRLTRPQVQFKLALSEPPKAPVSLTEKYRPRSLSQVVGQGEVLFRLQSFIEAPYSGAFLFVGPTGIGKTTIALALAAELGACEYGGLHVIKSGMQDAEAVESVLRDLRYTPMMGSGWKVVIVDEADYMSVKAAQLWLSSLEELPPRSVIVFTTNHPEKFKDRFVDRCERLDFQFRACEHAGDAQSLADSIWKSETGSRRSSPNVQYLKGVVDENGAISYRRVVRALEPLLAQFKAGRTIETPAPDVLVSPVSPAPDVPLIASIEALEPVVANVSPVHEPVRVAPMTTNAAKSIDWESIAARYRSGIGLSDLSRSCGVPATTVHGRLKKMGVQFTHKHRRHA